ncbi:MAG: hypothetical protein J6I84_02830 [Bacilli bacterium]|nr:hypothetical protein [Bacilli bacterium]
MGKRRISEDGLIISRSIYVHESGHFIGYCKSIQQNIKGRVKRKHYVRHIQGIKIHTGGGTITFDAPKYNRNIYLDISGVAYELRAYEEKKKVSWIDLFRKFVTTSGSDLKRYYKLNGFLDLRKRVQKIMDEITEKDINVINSITEELTIGNNYIGRDKLTEFAENYVDIKVRRERRSLLRR